MARLSAPPLGDRDLLVDGEVIALNDRGVPDFRVLQPRMHVRNRQEVARLVTRVPATLMVFDLLRPTARPHDPAAGGASRAARGAAAGRVALAGARAYDDGDMLFTATLQQGLEGVVSKRRGSRYHFDRRSDDCASSPTATAARSWSAAGARQSAPRTGLAALLVGEVTEDGLAYRGGVGSGIAGATSARLARLLEPYAADASPFRRGPEGGGARGTSGSSRGSWSTSTPTGWATTGCASRRSQGGRDDLTPRTSGERGGRSTSRAALTISNLDKVL